MFNVTVLKMRDIIKYLVGIIITIIIVIYTTRYFSSKKQETKNIKINSGILSKYSFIQCLDKTIPTLSEINNEYNETESENQEENIEKTDNNYLQFFLQTEISSMKGIEKLEENKEEIQEEQNTQNETKKDEETKIELAKNNISTEIVTQNPISENYNVEYGSVKIKNQTTYTLTEEIMKPDITIENKNVLIFHTHSCESYTSSEKYPYNPTGNFRTTDLNYTVTRVGTELENYLKQYNINVSHNTSYHDYPAYNGSYTRSLQTVENELQTTPSDIIIDLHRDAIGSREDYAPTVKIGEDYAAQIMFVIRNK